MKDELETALFFSMVSKEFSIKNENKIHQISFKKIKSKLLKKYPKFKFEFKIIKV